MPTGSDRIFWFLFSFRFSFFCQPESRFFFHLRPILRPILNFLRGFRMWLTRVFLCGIMVLEGGILWYLDGFVSGWMVTVTPAVSTRGSGIVGYAYDSGVFVLVAPYFLPYFFFSVMLWGCVVRGVAAPVVCLLRDYYALTMRRSGGSVVGLRRRRSYLLTIF